jgi:hypothetical protein
MYVEDSLQCVQQPESRAERVCVMYKTNLYCVIKVGTNVLKSWLRSVLPVARWLVDTTLLPEPH